MSSEAMEVPRFSSPDEEAMAMARADLLIENGIDVTLMLDWSQNEHIQIRLVDFPDLFCSQEYSNMCAKDGYSYLVTLGYARHWDDYPSFEAHRAILNGRTTRLHFTGVSRNWVANLDFDRLEDFLVDILQETARLFNYERHHNVSM